MLQKGCTSATSVSIVKYDLYGKVSTHKSMNIILKDHFIPYEIFLK